MRETVTVRLPKSVHTKAKVAASRAEMSLQDWISSVANTALAAGGEEAEPPVPFARDYHNLPPRLKKGVQDFVELLTLGSRESVDTLVNHIVSMTQILRRCDPKFLREFRRL